MNFRQATEDDLREVAETTISRGCREFPETIDLVYALEHDGNVLGVGGVKLMNATTAWVWLDLAESARKHMILAYRLLVNWMNAYMAEKGIVRLMAAVDCEFTEGRLLVEHLGFHLESRMARFFGDHDAYCYVRLSEA